MDTNVSGTYTGHLLLGGINTKRYQGSLITLPTSISTIDSTYDFLSQAQLTIKLSSVSVTTAKGNTNVSVPVDFAPIALIHSDVTTLNPEAAVALWDAVGAEYDKTNDPFFQYPIVPCSFLSNSSTIDFEFEGLTLQVPISSLVRHNGTGQFADQGEYGASCVFLVWAEAKGAFTTLSALALRNLYTVYDLSNNLISVALTDFNSTEDKVVEIPPGGIAAIDPKILGTANGTTNGTPAKKKKSHLGLAVGLGVGIPVFLILCLVVFLLIRRRRRMQRKLEAAAEADRERISHGNELAASEVKGNNMSSTVRVTTEEPATPLSPHGINELPASENKANKPWNIETAPPFSPHQNSDPNELATSNFRAIELSNGGQLLRSEMQSPLSTHRRSELPAGHDSQIQELLGS
jgi:hypothetical protein